MPKPCLCQPTNGIHGNKRLAIYSIFLGSKVKQCLQSSEATISVCPARVTITSGSIGHFPMPILDHVASYRGDGFIHPSRKSIGTLPSIAVYSAGLELFCRKINIEHFSQGYRCTASGSSFLHQDRCRMPFYSNAHGPWLWLRPELIRSVLPMVKSSVGAIEPALNNVSGRPRGEPRSANPVNSSSRTMTCPVFGRCVISTIFWVNFGMIFSPRLCRQSVGNL